MDRIMVITATCTEFHKAAVTPANPKKKLRDSMSKDGMKFLGKPVTSDGADSALTISR
ncbi:hypothetical protein D3C87_1771500 [compost metagenome]